MGVSSQVHGNYGPGLFNVSCIEHILLAPLRLRVRQLFSRNLAKAQRTRRSGLAIQVSIKAILCGD